MFEDPVEAVRGRVLADPHAPPLRVRRGEQRGRLLHARDARQRPSSPARAAVGPRDLAAQARCRRTSRVAEPRGSNAPRTRAKPRGRARRTSSAWSRPCPCPPVLAGQRSARVEAGLEDRLGEVARPLRLSRLGVVEDEGGGCRPRVEDVAHTEAVRGRQLLDAPQDLGQPGPRHDAVLDVVVGRDATHRGERRLPPPPEEGARRRPKRRISNAPAAPQMRSTSAASSSTCTATPSSSTSRTAPAPGSPARPRAPRPRSSAGPSSPSRKGGSPRRRCRRRRPRRRRSRRTPRAACARSRGRARYGA